MQGVSSRKLVQYLHKEEWTTPPNVSPACQPQEAEPMLGAGDDMFMMLKHTSSVRLMRLSAICQAILPQKSLRSVKK